MRAGSPSSPPGPLGCQLETPLEAERRAIIARNQQRLAALGLLDNPLSAAAEERRQRGRDEQLRQEEERRRAVLAGEAPATEPQRRSRRLCGEQPELPMQKKLPSCCKRRAGYDEEAATPWPQLRQPLPLLGSRSFIEQARHDLLLLDDEDELLGSRTAKQGRQQQQKKQKRRRLTEGVLRKRMDNHNAMSIQSMSHRALRTRIQRIRNIDKMRSFIRVLGRYGMEDLAAEARAALRRLHD